jgi:hypothetical protein
MPVAALLLLNIHPSPLLGTEAFTQQATVLSRWIHSDARGSSTNALHASNPTTNAQAQQLIDRAAKLREEIARMEGKTVEEVETEARTKKEAQLKRTQDAELENAQRRSAATNKVVGGPDDGRFLQIPTTADDMVRQAAKAVERAFRDGKTRQTVRFALVAAEELVADDSNEWPGGTQQMYREAGKPLTNALLKEIYALTPDQAAEESMTVNSQRLPPSVEAQDIWDFDGSALHTAKAALGAKGDVQALVFPNTDVKYIKDIETISQAMGPRLFLLVNPFWRNIESWGMNILAPGAKKKAQNVIFDNGYDETYVLLRFSARGEKCAAVKAYPYDWQLFAYREDDTYGGRMMENVIRLGSCKAEPTSALMAELLNERPEFKETKTMRQMKNFF